MGQENKQDTTLVEQLNTEYMAATNMVMNAATTSVGDYLALIPLMVVSDNLNAEELVSLALADVRQEAAALLDGYFVRIKSSVPEGVAKHAQEGFSKFEETASGLVHDGIHSMATEINKKLRVLRGVPRKSKSH